MRFARRALIIGAAVGLIIASATQAFADVQITVQNGRVTLMAKDATIRQILAEWARVGQTTIVNAERVPGGPVSLQLTDVPEEQALDILLRSISGYMAAPRATAVGNASRYDRIVVVPTLAAARPAASAVAAAPQQPAPPPPLVAGPGQPGITSPPTDDDNDDDKPAPTVVMPPRGPIFTTFQQPQTSPQQPVPATAPGVVPPMPAPGVQPQVANPNGEQPGAAPPPYPNATTPSSAPATVGTPRPGMVVQPPTQPGQTQPGQVQPQQRSPDD